MNGNSAKNETILKKNNTTDRMVEILAIFLNEFWSFTIGGKKYSMEILEKANILLRPVNKGSFKPTS